MERLAKSHLTLSNLVSLVHGANPRTLQNGQPNERVEALKAWKDALLSQHEVSRRLSALEQEGRGARQERSPQSIVPADVPSSRRRSPGAASISYPHPLDLSKTALPRQVSQVGGRIPDFSYYGPVKRFFARQTARVVLFLAGIVTAHQRAYNTSVLDFVTNCADVTNKLIESSRSLEAELSRLRLDLDRRNLELERELATAHVAAAWFRLVELDTRDELRGVASVLSDLAEIVAELPAPGPGGPATSWANLPSRERAATADKVGPDDRAQLQEVRSPLSPASRDRGTTTADAIHHLHQEIGALRDRLKAEEEDAGPLPQPSQIDRLYARFEDRFRGSRELIKRRLEYYLPVLSEAGVGSAERPILDLGCGRGEWLELLQDSGYSARGIDLNPVAVAGCRELDLDVVHEDVLHFLRRSEPSTWGMLTGFHLLEHLTFEYQIHLFTEALRVLQPGGLILIETPNPENLLVSTQHFHYDPTHLHPLDSQALAFFMEECGFVDLETRRLDQDRPTESLNRIHTSNAVAPSLNPLIDFLNAHFAAAPDYAVIGRKPQ